MSHVTFELVSKCHPSIQMWLPSHDEQDPTKPLTLCLTSTRFGSLTERFTGVWQLAHASVLWSCKWEPGNRWTLPNGHESKTTKCHSLSVIYFIMAANRNVLAMNYGVDKELSQKTTWSYTEVFSLLNSAEKSDQCNRERFWGAYI